jgi:hypothetical protein
MGLCHWVFSDKKLSEDLCSLVMQESLESVGQVVEDFGSSVWRG